jgi:copper transport protein
MACSGRSLLALSAGAVVAAGFFALASAHAILQKSEPARGATLATPPTHVRLWFNERLDLALSAIQVTGPAGKIEVGKVQAVEPRVLSAPLTGSLADGGYKVAWQTAGDDGHIEKGAFEFVLKRAR